MATAPIPTSAVHTANTVAPLAGRLKAASLSSSDQGSDARAIKADKAAETVHLSNRGTPGDPPMRSARIEELKQAIADGSYHVDSARVAGKMMAIEFA